MKVIRVHCKGSPRGDYWHEVQDGVTRLPDGMTLRHPDVPVREEYRRQEDGTYRYVKDQVKKAAP